MARASDPLVTADRYKGEDIDSDGDGKVDSADDADNLGGQPPEDYDQSAHVGDTTNPHGVTAAQAGAIEDSAGSVSQSNLDFDPATQTELDNSTTTAEDIQSEAVVMSEGYAPGFLG